MSNLEFSLSSSLTESDPGTLLIFGELFNVSILDPLLPTLLLTALSLCVLSALTYHSLALTWELFWASRQSSSSLDPSAEVVLTMSASSSKFQQGVLGSCNNFNTSLQGLSPLLCQQSP